MRLIDADALDMYEALKSYYGDAWRDAQSEIDNAPTVDAEPTLYGYDIKQLELIARILQKENLPPERVADALSDIGRIIEIVYDEFTESLSKAVCCEIHPPHNRATDEKPL